MSASVDKLAYWLLKPVERAIRAYDMIGEGDRVAVAVSGGKDSLTLLRLLAKRRATTAVHYELTAIHVIGDARGPAAPVHLPLLSWLEQSGIQAEVVPLLLPEGESLPLGCQRCTWNRRRTLFETARRLNCNVISLGHHADDLAQTTLLNLLYNARAESMAPRREYFDGLLRVIRPLCFVPEAEIRRFARASDFPPPPPACPQGEHSRRRFVAGLLREAEHECRSARTNLLRAGLKYLEDSEEARDPK